MMDATTRAPRVIQGDLTQVYVPRLLHYLYDAGKTGVLVLSDGDRQVQVHVREGQVVFVSSGFMPGLSLADFLVARKILPEEVLLKASTAAQQAGKRLGVYLVENALVAPQALFETLNLQIKAKLFRAFTWVRGQYAFREGDAVEPSNQNVAINLANVIYEGLRDYVPMEKLPREFRGRKDDPMFRRAPARIELGDLRMRGREIQMIKLVDGKRSLRDVVAQSAGENKKEAYKALYGLYVLGFVGFAENVTTRAAKAAAARPRGPEDDDASPDFAVRGSEDLIREALASVDRIRRESGSAPLDSLEEADLSVDLSEPGVENEASAAPPRPARGAEPPAPERSVPAPVNAERRRPEDRQSPIEDETLALELEEPIDLEAVAPSPPSRRADPESPATYSADDLRPKAPAPAEREAPPLDADDALQRAEFFLTRLDYAEAVPLLRQAREQKPRDPEIAPLLAWAIYNAGQGSREAFLEAEKLLRQVNRADPSNWRAFLYLGRIYKANDQRDFAELHLVRALELNRDCVEAKEEIKNLYK